VLAEPGTIAWPPPVTTSSPESGEPLALLLLPSKLEEFELAAHARNLLSIPRVLALEPSRRRTPRFLRQSAPVHAAKRLRFPGEPRVIVLYHPEQYPLARALSARYTGAEIWYIRPDRWALRGEGASEDWPDLDRLAAERAGEGRVGDQRTDLSELEEGLAIRLRELGVISSRPFIPGARIHGI
jgi:hypothetical protein